MTEGSQDKICELLTELAEGQREIALQISGFERYVRGQFQIISEQITSLDKRVSTLESGIASIVELQSGIEESQSKMFEALRAHEQRFADIEAKLRA